MKKSTKILLTAGAAVALLVSASSCGNRRAKKEAEAERARKEAAAAQKAADDAAKTLELQINKEKKAVYDHARDSVLDANGYDKEVWYQLDAAQSKLRELDDLSQKTILREHVDTLVAKQVRQSTNEIESLLTKYKIWVDDKENLFNKVEGEYFDHINNRSIVKENSEDFDEAEKAKMLGPQLPYNFFGNSEGKDSRYDSYVVDWYNSEYGESRQKEIEDGVLKIFDKMNQALDKAIPAEVKKFAVYYPELDIEKSGMPAEYRKYYDVDRTLYSFDEGYGFEYAQSRLLVMRTISVYDSKLKVDFFGEEDATYKLVKVSEGKWQVVRTDKNGHVAKTPVFSHNRDYNYAVYSTDCEYDVWNDAFSFEPGANKGVHVDVREVVWSKKGKDDKYPDPTGKIAAKRDSVAKEVARLEVLNDRMSQIYHQADSVAKIKQQQYMARRFNKR